MITDDTLEDDVPLSAVKQVSNLAIGKSYCRAEFIPAFHVTPDRIRNLKASLMRDASPVIARAKKATCNEYRAHTIHSFTRDYNVVVAIIVVREEDAPLHYSEIQQNGLWYAKQECDIYQRRSIYGYPERVDLVATLAFGKHKWSEWRRVE